MDQWTDESWKRNFELIYRCRLSALYHRKRERFFSLWDKGSTAITLIAGSAAFSRFVTTESFAILIGLAVVLASMLKLVFSWPDKARAHAVLAQKFIQLEATMAASGAMTAAQLDQFQSQIITLDAEEPPGLSALVRLCQNELDKAQGNYNPKNALRWYERWFCQLLDISKPA